MFIRNSVHSFSVLQFLYETIGLFLSINESITNSLVDIVGPPYFGISFSRSSELIHPKGVQVFFLHANLSLILRFVGGIANLSLCIPSKALYSVLFWCFLLSRLSKP